MTVTIVVGTQWGDEGKGKVIDYYAENADYIVRFQGGNNAGHTIQVGNDVFKFHLLPSGIIRPDKTVVIGNGMVIDPIVLLNELEELKIRGVTPAKLFISDRANVIMPYHKILDKAEESSRGEANIGTTGRGIGPAYTDKISRHGIRIGDLLEKETLKEKLEILIPIKQRQISAMNNSTRLSVSEIFGEYIKYGESLRKFVVDTSVLLNQALENRKNILYEGAQGAQLDIDHGTYPYVTSSNTIAGNACLGSGIGPLAVDSVIGIVKAYTTRVGKGPFPTEQENEIGELIRQNGKEFGTTTGRPRRCGWLDLVIVKTACRLNGLSALAITRLDVLGGIPELKICSTYECEGDSIDYFPSSLKRLNKCVPVYKTLPGWPDLNTTEWRQVANKGYDALHENLIKYLDYIELMCKTPIKIISIGPGREDTIMRE